MKSYKGAGGISKYISERFNWVDVIIVILIIAIGFGGFVFLGKRKASSGAAEVAHKKLYFVFETEHKSPDSIDSYKEGTKVVFGEKKVDKGVITGVEIIPQKTHVPNIISGKWEEVETPNEVAVRLRIEFEGVETERSFSGGQEQITVGLGTVVEGLGVNSSGVILGIGSVE